MKLVSESVKSFAMAKTFTENAAKVWAVEIEEDARGIFRQWERFRLTRWRSRKMEIAVSPPPMTIQSQSTRCAKEQSTEKSTRRNMASKMSNLLKEDISASIGFKLTPSLVNFMLILVRTKSTMIFGIKNWSKLNTSNIFRGIKTVLFAWKCALAKKVLFR